MEGIVDIHAHILPGADDGAADWEEARWMLRCGYGQGIRTIIATPHYSHRQETARLRELAARLHEEAQKIDTGFHVYLGQEILYFDSMAKCLGSGEALTMAGSRYVLVEFMPDMAYARLYQAVRGLLMSGYYPVAAHVERCKALRNEENMEELSRAGCRMQMNYRSLEGSILDRNVRWCRKQVTEGRIDFLSTDAHHKSYRTPVISKSLKWLGAHTGQEQLEAVTRKNALEILGQSLCAED